MTKQILIAGFGGQGILFAGKFLASGALIEDKQVSWLPSYGPEMRGGTANCSVIISDEPIGSPIVLKPDVLVAMNLPSYTKFVDDVKPGGTLLVDSALIGEKTTREDIAAHYLPATKIASDEGFGTLANMLMLGKLLKETGLLTPATVEATLTKIVPQKKQDLLELNRRAIALGMSL